MTSGSSDRLDRIEALLQQSVIASDERMTRIEQSLANTDELLKQSIVASNQRLTRIEQLVESNNRFLETFSSKIDRYTERMDAFAGRIDGVIATNNQDRQESNSRLAVIQRQVSAIAKHLGVT